MSSKDLVIQKLSNSPLVKKEYKQMLTNINSNLPAIKKSSSNFYKSHSQFMGVMLDVTAITPIRSVKHTLAELDKTRMALEEAQLKMMKKDIELRQKEKKLADGDYKDELERELLETEILTGLRLLGINSLSELDKSYLSKDYAFDSKNVLSAFPLIEEGY